MNLAEFNFLNRQKVQKQLILPHPPTYVTQQKCKNSDVWYFTSQKFLTLKKKRQNTSFMKFIKNTQITKQQRQQNQEISISSDLKENKQIRLKQKINLQGNNSLLLIHKERANYIESKLMHIIKQHKLEFNRIKNSDEKRKCTICEKLEQNDYDFGLIERGKFLQKYQQIERQISKKQEVMKKQQQKQCTQLSVIIDRVLQGMLFTKKQQLIGENRKRQQISQKQLPISTFNPYLDNIGGQFKYYVTRIQTFKEKHHFMVTNTNRINYRQKVQSDRFLSNSSQQNTIVQIDQSNLHKRVNHNFIRVNQFWQRIGSVLWNQQYLLFDVQKHHPIPYNNYHHNLTTTKSTKISNNHMKQKITQKCQILQNYLETYFSQLFYQTFKTYKLTNKIIHHLKNIKTKVKQFRLWYLNNNMRNNHIYTICITDLKVQFSYQQNAQSTKRWLAEFWTRVDLKKNCEFINKKFANYQQKAQQKQKSFIQLQSGSIKRPKIKQSYHQSNKKYKLVEKNDINFIQNVNKLTRQFVEQSVENLKQQKCSCCKDLLKLLENDNEQEKIVKRYIVLRHLIKLRQNLKLKIEVQMKTINQQLSKFSLNSPNVIDIRSKEQITRQNRLILQLQQKQLKINGLNKLLQTESKKQMSIYNQLNKRKEYESLLSRQYDEVPVCEQCYIVFLKTVMKQKHVNKKNLNKTDQIDKQIKENEKIHSFLIKRNIQTKKQIKNKPRKRILSAKINKEKMISTSLCENSRIFNNRNSSLYCKQLISHNKTLNRRILNIQNQDVEFNPFQISNDKSKRQKNSQKERQSTKDNTTIFQFLPKQSDRVTIQRQSINIDVDADMRKKKKTRMERFQELLQMDHQ